MPLRDGLAFAIDALKEYGLKDEIKVLASGKVLSGFDMARIIAIGADVCYSARAAVVHVPWALPGSIATCRRDCSKCSHWLKSQ